MKDSEFKMLIGKVHLWAAIPTKGRKEIIRSFLPDEAMIGTEAHQEAYREALRRGDSTALGKLRKQAETRRTKALSWLAKNGY